MTTESKTVSLTVIGFSVEYQRGRWCGSGQEAVAAFLSRPFLPWPIRASISTNRAGLKVGEEHVVGGAKKPAWLPSVMPFSLTPSEGMILEGQFFVEPEELEIVRQEGIAAYTRLADRCLASTNEVMKKFNEQPPAQG